MRTLFLTLLLIPTVLFAQVTLYESLGHTTQIQYNPTKKIAVVQFSDDEGDFKRIIVRNAEMSEDSAYGEMVVSFDNTLTEQRYTTSVQVRKYEDGTIKSINVIIMDNVLVWKYEEIQINLFYTEAEPTAFVKKVDQFKFD